MSAHLPCPACHRDCQHVGSRLERDCDRMAPALTINEIRITPGSEEDRGAGLLAYASCRYGDLLLAGLAVRKTMNGRTVVTFPAKRSGEGKQHFLITPTTVAVRRTIEDAVLAAFWEASA